jgi:hypothetical protein
VKHILTAPLPVILSVLVLVLVTFGQQEQTEGGRKIVSRVMPHYPEIARTMHLSFAHLLGEVGIREPSKRNGFVTRSLIFPVKSIVTMDGVYLSIQDCNSALRCSV